jgi:4-amino-4-deoxy-L-arabinose transferase-like glycosyltransferase
MPRKSLAVILVLYLALATGFAVVTPFGTPPDETAHALYVQHLAQQRRLPVLRRERRDAYEFHQPPLFYLLAAPAWAAGSLLSPAAANMAARGVSILIGAVGVWLIAALAAAVGSPGGAAADALALGAAGFAAFLPMRLATAAAVSNDTLAEAIFTAGLLLMVGMLRHGLNARRAAWLGLILGLGVLTKSSDLLLFPVALVALLLACQTVDGRRQTVDVDPKRTRAPLPELPSTVYRLPSMDFLRCALVTLGVALLIGGGWMARNTRLYGDPLGTRAFEQYFQDTHSPALWKQLLDYNLLDVLWRKDVPLTFDSFWGVFGHMEIFMGAYAHDADAPGWACILADHHYPPASWLYPLLLIPTLAAAAGLGVQAFRRSGVQVFRRSGVEERPSDEPTPERLNARTPERLVLFLAWFLVLAAFVRFNTEFFQAQGRYLFPAMGPTALGFAAGWLAWWPARRRGAALLLLLGGMLALALYALLGTLVPVFGH